MLISKVKSITCAVALTAFLLQACDPVPRRTLSNEEKAADLAWVFSQFNENYAPLDYKEQRFGFKFEDLKTHYSAASSQTRNNEEFYELLATLVSEFKDAHTSGALTNSSLPDRARIAYLGFTGVREGNALFVQELLPTISADSNFPIKKGDRITKLDGRPLVEVIQQDMVRFRNLGHAEANNSWHMNKIFTRLSTSNGLPKKDTAVITFERDDVLTDVTLPWVLKDVYDFKNEQDLARKTKTEFIDFNGALEFPALVLEKIAARTRTTFSDGFRFMEGIAGWTALTKESDEPKTPADVLKMRRWVPDNAVFLSEAKTYPAYVSRQARKNREGKSTSEKKLIGYIFLDTFSPLEIPEVALGEFNRTLLAMETLGVQDIVIDMLNNGGGSLILGMQLAQALSTDKVIQPDIQYRLSDGWLDQFETESLRGSSDAEKEIGRRLLKEMLEDKAAGRRLSRRYSAETLAPYLINPGSGLSVRFNIAVVVNEMCASMCDIFAGILQDNGMATVVGSRTLGAGGNVVSYDQAPNSHLTLRQTESLIVRKDGSYIENNGVSPDVEVATWNYRTSGYEEVLDAAVQALFK